MCAPMRLGVMWVNMGDMGDINGTCGIRGMGGMGAPRSARVDASDPFVAGREDSSVPCSTARALGVR